MKIQSNRPALDCRAKRVPGPRDIRRIVRQGEDVVTGDHSAMLNSLPYRANLSPNMGSRVVTVMEEETATLNQIWMAAQPSHGFGRNGLDERAELGGGGCLGGKIDRKELALPIPPQSKLEVPRRTSRVGPSLDDDVRTKTSSKSVKETPLYLPDTAAGESV